MQNTKHWGTTTSNRRWQEDRSGTGKEEHCRKQVRQTVLAQVKYKTGRQFGHRSSTRQADSSGTGQVQDDRQTDSSGTGQEQDDRQTVRAQVKYKTGRQFGHRSSTRRQADRQFGHRTRTR